MDDTDRYGIGLEPGGPHYRAYVGAPQLYDLVGGLQFTLLFTAGLRETHSILDVGCGSLRVGRLLIPYLRPGHYVGVEPNEWLVRDGIANELGEDILRIKEPRFVTIDDFSFGTLGQSFDFVLAQSILTHTFDDLAGNALSGIADCLGRRGVLLATFLEADEPRDGSGWSYPECVFFNWPELRSIAEGAGLSVQRLRWPHPRQQWFAGSLDRARAEEVAAQVAAGLPYTDRIVPPQK